MQVEMGNMREGFRVNPAMALRLRVWSLLGAPNQVGVFAETPSFRLEALVLTNKGLVPFELVVVADLIGGYYGRCNEGAIQMPDGILVSVTYTGNNNGYYYQPALSYLVCDLGLNSRLQIKTDGIVAPQFTRLTTLFSGYPNTSGLGWQNGVATFNGERPPKGAIVVMDINNGIVLAADTDDWVANTPTNSISLLNAVRFDFLTSASAANRRPGFKISQQDSSLFYVYYSLTFQTATSGRTMAWSRGYGLSSGVVSSTEMNSIGHHELVSGYDNATQNLITQFVVARDASDTTSNIEIEFEQWINPYSLR